VPERTAFCVANNCRPYLSVGPPGKGRRESFKFTDAIESFGEQLYISDLAKAYERAGLMFTGDCLPLICLAFSYLHLELTLNFTGKMAKYFLVMNDQVALELHNQRKEQMRRGPKRTGEPLSADPAKR